jgi:hypothetical protein
MGHQEDPKGSLKNGHLGTELQSVKSQEERYIITDKNDKQIKGQ